MQSIAFIPIGFVCYLNMFHETSFSVMTVRKQKRKKMRRDERRSIDIFSFSPLHPEFFRLHGLTYCVICG